MVRTKKRKTNRKKESCERCPGLTSFDKQACAGAPGLSMSDQPKTYIAGIGMITPIGANTAMTAAAVRAGVSAYQASDYLARQTRQPITMTCVPNGVFTSMQIEIDAGGDYSDQYEHIVKMAILALREAVSGQSINKPIPLILAIPEPLPGVSYIEPQALIKNLVKQKDLPLHADLVRCIDTGRAAGIQGLELAMHYLSHQKADFVLIGGSDSHADATRIGALDKAGRLLAPGSTDGFAPGEAAGFLLLTRHPQWALTRDNQIVALCPPGNSQEPGHLYSSKTYRGDGLDQAFKQALNNHPGSTIRTIYSSMNGEHHWAKEYGVAFTRNQASFHDSVKIEHPADCYGDLGAATGPVLIGLAADDLLRKPGLATHLVYSSSDGALRAAVRVEKLPLTANQTDNS